METSNKASEMSREANIFKYELNLHYNMIKTIAGRYMSGGGKCLSPRDITTLNASVNKIRTLTSKLRAKTEMADALERLNRDIYVLNAEDEFIKHATDSLNQIRKKQKKSSHKLKKHKTFCKKLDKYIDESDQEVVASYVRELKANPELEGYSDTPTFENPYEIIEQFDSSEKNMDKFLTAVHKNDNFALPDVPTCNLPKKSYHEVAE